MSNDKEIDWSKAPADATHWHDEYDCYAACWVKEQEGQRYYARADSEWITWNKDRNPLPIDKCIPRPAAQPAWTGEGLPPVGVACEVENDIEGGWDAVDEVLAHTEIKGAHVAVFKRNDRVFYSTAGTFRPLRTPEQIAAEEREKAVSQMAVVALAGDNHLITKVYLERLYDAGYRLVTP